MNKTVNINLAGIFFHIDEDAYLKLQRYLEAIKRSFTDSQGRAEIISDIEARIAELFSERVKHDKQVIGTKEVEEVIGIMGQPEDYLVDDEIFEDEPMSSSYSKSTRSSSTKKLFRDRDNSYIAGVSSGLGHYLGIDAIWVRLLWILLTIGSGGTFIFIYILFWILVPEAVTTAEKLTMTGEPVNISNIEKKIRDGIDNVSETVKNVDYEKYGQRVKSGSKNFFDTIGDVLLFLLKLFAKFIGVILIIIGVSLLFGLIVSLLSFGSSTYFHPWWLDYPDALNTTGLPLWLGSVLLFFLFGIPLFFILYLGLRILITNLKSIGRVAKFTLLGLWLLSVVGSVVISIKEASHFALENSVSQTEKLTINPQDTLQIKMVASDYDKYKYGMHRSNGFEVKYNTEDEKVIFSRNVRLTIKSTQDSVASLIIMKEAKGSDFIEARNTAENIDYNYSFNGKTLSLNNYLHTDFENKFLDQNVNLVLQLPVGTVFKLDQNTASFLDHRSYEGGLVSFSDASHLLMVMEDEVICIDCDVEDEFDVNINIQKEENGLIINSQGIKIKDNGDSLEINSDGIKGSSDDVKMDITEDGIHITNE
ncbi:PspC domain-containing protein [Mangrovimonas sp. AS39]|uniref:PspC domain-containing protein n=1 Tax=Mangrovimonas futianensis TaxID=2895523 RepID=UPI001E47947A|nr:PspC domain-containing protein [Mangrovimonas futianensis]MCF1192071.1 PspC domain-containing protein [Mangrovimonas futianensis]MCF1195765.1 PspC domain-containing protein [Mangrovimonas futianensis]